MVGLPLLALFANSLVEQHDSVCRYFPPVMNTLIEPMLQIFKETSAFEAFGLFLALNTVIFAVSVALCHALGRRFGAKRLFDRWEPLRAIEIVAAVGSIVLNALISIVGWWLWRQGFISIHVGTWIEAGIHCVGMMLFMDVGMYLFHRLAHAPLPFRWMHAFHHRHESTNPISLFVLHPFEVLGFGMLMIAYLMLFPTEVCGLIAYLSLNVLWGTLGHSGVEPFPASLLRIPIIRLIGTSTFHAEHHEHLKYNFGFYTLIWDRLLGTLDPEYEQRFRDAKPPVATTSGLNHEGQNSAGEQKT